VPWGNEVDEKAAGIWGGTCTCPDGLSYAVGDNKDFCQTLACGGGASGACHKDDKGPWAVTRQKVRCATAPPTGLSLLVKSSEPDMLLASPTAAVAIAGVCCLTSDASQLCSRCGTVKHRAHTAHTHQVQRELCLPSVTPAPSRWTNACRMERWSTLR